MFAAASLALCSGDLCREVARTEQQCWLSLAGRPGYVIAASPAVLFGPVRALVVFRVAAYV